MLKQAKVFIYGWMKSKKDRLEKEHMTYPKRKFKPPLTIFHNSIYFCYVKRIKKYLYKARDLLTLISNIR